MERPKKKWFNSTIFKISKLGRFRFSDHWHTTGNIRLTFVTCSISTMYIKRWSHCCYDTSISSFSWRKKIIELLLQDPNSNYRCSLKYEWIRLSQLQMWNKGFCTNIWRCLENVLRLQLPAFMQNSNWSKNASTDWSRKEYFFRIKVICSC